jgi:hypothetical protein
MNWARRWNKTIKLEREKLRIGTKGLGFERSRIVISNGQEHTRLGLPKCA